MTDIQKVYVVNPNRFVFSITGLEIMGMAGIAYTLVRGIKGVTDDIIYIIQVATPSIVKVVPQIMITLMEAVISGLPEILEQITEGIGILLPTILGTIQKVIPELTKNIGQTINWYFKEYVPAFYKMLGDTLKNIWDSILGKKPDIVRPPLPDVPKPEPDPNPPGYNDYVSDGPVGYVRNSNEQMEKISVYVASNFKHSYDNKDSNSDMFKNFFIAGKGKLDGRIVLTPSGWSYWTQNEENKAGKKIIWRKYPGL